MLTFGPFNILYHQTELLITLIIHCFLPISLVRFAYQDKVGNTKNADSEKLQPLFLGLQLCSSLLYFPTCLKILKENALLTGLTIGIIYPCLVRL